MNKKYIVFLMIILFLASVNVHAKSDIKIVILDFEPVKIHDFIPVKTSKFASRAVTEFIRREMAGKGNVTIIAGSNIKDDLNKHGKCTETGCAVETGKALSARKVIIGTLLKDGDSFITTAKVIDVETGKIDFTETERCLKEVNLEASSKILAVKLVNQIAGTKLPVPEINYPESDKKQVLINQEYLKKKHEGFFLRLNPAFTFTSVLLKAHNQSDSLGDNTKSYRGSGFGLMLDLQLGWAPVNNLIIFGDITNLVVPFSKMDPATDDPNNTDYAKNPITIHSFGAGLCYYHIPENIYFSLSPAFFIVRFPFVDYWNSSHNEYVNKSYGTGINFSIGKEWLGAGKTGYGIALVGSFFKTSSSDVFKKDDYGDGNIVTHRLEGVTGLYLGLGFSFTYN